MLANKDHFKEYQPICHSFLENGKWRFLGDCTHEMANMQDVSMIPIDESMGFWERHGVKVKK